MKINKIIILVIINLALMLGINTMVYAKGAHASCHSHSSAHTTHSTVHNTPKTSTHSTTHSTTKKTINSYKSFKPKYNESNIKKDVVNNNPTHYRNYSSNNFFTPNAWTAMWLFQCAHDNTEKISEQDIAKELEQRGYSQEEIKEILEEGKKAQEEDKKVQEEDKKRIKQALIILLITVIVAGIILTIIFKI